jgi:signal transduction histidine kinase
MSNRLIPRLSGSTTVALVCATALLMVLGLWLFVVFQVRHEREETVTAALRQNQNQVIALEQHVARTLQLIDVSTDFIGRRYSRLLRFTGPRRSVVRISDFPSDVVPFSEVTLLDAGGNLVASSLTPTPEPVNLIDTPIFQRHLRDPSTRLNVNPPSPSRFRQGWFVISSRRLADERGRFVGVVGIQVRPSLFTSVLQDAAVKSSDLISIIGLDGITRARRTGDVQGFGEDLRGKLVMRMQRISPNGTYLGPSGLDGMVRYFSHRRISRYRLFVTSGVSRDEVLMPVQRRAHVYYFTAFFISLVIIGAAFLLRFDVLRRVRREAIVRETNARLSEAQKIAKVGEWQYDLRHDAVRWSPELCLTYERDPRQDTIGLPDFTAFYGDSGAASFRGAVKQACETKERQELSLIAHLHEGKSSHRYIVFVPMLDQTGRVVGVRGTDQDISTRKLVESLKEQVAHLTRLDAMNAIASTLAHELNQPLTAATNYLSVCLHNLDNPRHDERGHLKDTLSAVHVQIRTAGEIIRRVRMMVSKRQPAVELFSLKESIQEAISLINAASPTCNAVISQDLCEDCDFVLADKIQVQQVLVNLIRNALDACPRQANIVVDSKCLPDHVQVSVSDNGPGMRGGQESAFSPFSTSKEGGLGLGLSISRTLVEAFGGQIWVRSTDKEGTVISFTLPRPHDVKDN